ncbi:hypothetical protein KHA80_05170 [Anaerobacillus sp. HL2]|nr:hypothetical protein KHA80_05170 [Anaerobacillus sp. HL2]
MTQLDTEVANRFHSFEEDLELLASIPGVDQHTAEHVLAEIGTDYDSIYRCQTTRIMGRFSSRSK